MKKKEEELGYYYFLGRTLFRERKRLGWSQEVAAEKIGINSSDLSRIENGKKPLGESRLFKICQIYRVKVADVTSKAHDQYQAYLFKKEPSQDKPVEKSLPDHPLASRVIEILDQYSQSQQEKEKDGHEKIKELILAFLHHMLSNPGLVASVQRVRDSTPRNG